MVGLLAIEERRLVLTSKNIPRATKNTHALCGLPCRHTSSYMPHFQLYCYPDLSQIPKIVCAVVKHVMTGHVWAFICGGIHMWAFRTPYLHDDLFKFSIRFLHIIILNNVIKCTRNGSWKQEYNINYSNLMLTRLLLT